MTSTKTNVKSSNSYFHNKTVYITGAASGLGLESAKQLASKGAKLVLFDIGSFDAVLSDIQAWQKNTFDIITKSIDVTDAEAVKTAVDSVAQTYPPDICMHFAGVTGPWTFDTMSQEQFERVVNINLFGTRNWLAAVRPYLKKGSQAMVTASMASFVGSYGYSSYAASKFAVWGMMQSIRTEWKPLGIDVTVFSPPHIDTPMTEFEVGRMDKVGLMLKKNAGKLDITEAIDALLCGMEKREFIVVPGVMANILRLQLKLLPQSLINRVTDLQLAVSNRFFS